MDYFLTEDVVTTENHCYDEYTQNYLYGFRASNMQNSSYLHIKNDIHSFFCMTDEKSVKVHFYGSRVFGLANRKSGLDIFVDTSEYFFILILTNFIAY